MKAQLLNHGAVIEILKLHSYELDEHYSPPTCKLCIQFTQHRGHQVDLERLHIHFTLQECIQAPKAQGKGEQARHLRFTFMEAILRISQIISLVCKHKNEF